MQTYYYNHIQFLGQNFIQMYLKANLGIENMNKYYLIFEKVRIGFKSGFLFINFLNSNFVLSIN